MNIRINLAALLLALLVSKAGGAGPLPVPAPAEEASLRQSIRNQYSDQYACSTDRKSQIALARLLWRESLAAQTPAEGYALLCEARDITARTEDLATAFRIAEMIAGKYAVTPAAARSGAFAAAADGIQGPQEADSYFKLLTVAVDQALVVDDFDSARRLIETGNATVSAQRAEFWAQPLSTRLTDLKIQQNAFAFLKPVIDRLRQDPSDPDAILALGKYECFIKGDWKTGLPMLEQGSDAFLQKAARIELAEPKTADERLQLMHWEDGRPQIKVADTWNYLEGIAPEYQLQVRLHVYDWYMRALPCLPEFEFDARTRIVNQLHAILPVVAGHRLNAPLFVHIADTLAQHSAKPTAIIGGALATNSFEDSPASGGFIIGFHYGLAKLNGQTMITWLQPIYSTPAGDREGTAVGKLFSKPQTAIAKAGYAIGALKITGDEGLNSITLAFMQIDGDHLNPASHLNPVHIGGNTGTPQVIDSQGEPIIGIRGRQNNGFLGLGAVMKVPVN